MITFAAFYYGMNTAFANSTSVSGKVPSGAKPKTSINAADIFAVEFEHEKQRYIQYARQIELEENLPRDLLVNLLAVESNYNPDAVGTSGEVGIAQIIPRFHPGANATDPFASIKYAGAYLRKLFGEFGSWNAALAAYNWGESNVRRKGLSAMPKSTREYITKITGVVSGA